MEIKEKEEGEKHLPYLNIKDENGLLRIEVFVGKGMHPNLYEHHIKWVELFFISNNQAYPLGRANFDGHGEKGLTEPRAVFYFKPREKGKILALSFCNVHGLWKKEVGV